VSSLHRFCTAATDDLISRVSCAAAAAAQLSLLLLLLLLLLLCTSQSSQLGRDVEEAPGGGLIRMIPNLPQSDLRARVFFRPEFEGAHVPY
jgi:hypothetical protein